RLRVLVRNDGGNDLVARVLANGAPAWSAHVLLVIIIIIVVPRTAPRLDRTALVFLNAFFDLGGPFPRRQFLAAFLAAHGLRWVRRIAMRTTHDRLPRTGFPGETGFSTASSYSPFRNLLKVSCCMAG